MAIQIIILSCTKHSKEMSNLSSEYEEGFSGDESQEVLGGSRIIKKAKTYAKKGHKMISAPIKKKKCQFYNMGTCNQGSLCKASHSFIPDVAKKICKTFLRGPCARGNSCPYSHNLSRYPCKFFHIQGKCRDGNKCCYSHEILDEEKELEFLEDNEDFLIALSQKGTHLRSKFIDYVREKDLLNPDAPRKIKSESKGSMLPFIFGFPLVRTVSKTQERKRNDQSREPYRKHGNSKKLSIGQNPFSIRMVYKNRLVIPERLPQFSAMDEEREKPLEVEDQFCSSENELQDEERSNKMEEGIELTPDSKVERVPGGLSQYACSYY